jgi:hypothetical protein
MEDKDKSCPYCGYDVPRKPYNAERAALLYRVEGNARGHRRRKDNLLSKGQILSARILTELSKIRDIDKLVENISQEQTRTKVLEARAKIESLVDSLIGCKVNLDFLRFANDYSVIENANRSHALQPERLRELLIDQDLKLWGWLSKLQEEFPRPVTLEYFTAKHDVARKLKERISLAMVSNILSSTTLLDAESSVQAMQSDEKDIDQEIERINYEIDRLNAEFELGKS